MGQQQLLLVILVTIIVGIATVVALNVFGASAKNANIDAVRQDILTIASSGQAYFIKPTMMGGGGTSFKGMKFNDINFAADSTFNSGLSASNLNGTYVISTRGDSSFVITAYPSSDAGYSKGAASGSSMQATVFNQNITWQKSSPQ
ncbi:MAG TPA: hypothetical protein VKA08_13760 [Balneolales bacterium]|nr:hypothetical protein [Balneolales bacterium]